MSKSFQARGILNLTEDQLWELDEQLEPTEKFTLEFDDVIIVTDIRKTIPMWYLWKLHRLYPQTPLLAEHHTEGSHFDGKSVPKLLTKIVASMLATYGMENLDYDLLSKQCYEISNDLYNMVSGKLGAYVETVDMRDVVEVYYHPTIQSIREKCIAEGTPKAINELFDNIMATMKEDSFLPGNSLVETMRMKNSPPKQINQCIGIVGYRTDIDSRMFPHPVMTCFAAGLKKFNDFIIESRSASKALLFQKDPIRDTEYFNRRIQLLNQSVRFLIPGDCGTNVGLPWEVQPGDLPHMAGKFYITENGLRAIDPKSRESQKLVGTTVLLRSPLYCKHAAYNGVCHTCLGLISKTIPKGSNVGHITAFTMCAKITQAVLSVKHLDGSTEVKEITLDSVDRRYVRLSSEKSENIKMVRKWKNQPTLYMLLPVDNVTNLTQAMQTTSLTSLSIYRISQLYKIGFKYTQDDMEVIDWVTVSGPSRPSSLTIPFLSYIRNVKYYQEDPKYLEVPMKDWDFDLPILQLPQKQINMLDFMKHFSNMLEGSPKSGVKKGLDPHNPNDLSTYLRELLEYSQQHVDIPFYCLEVTALALMIRNESDNDYRISTYDSDREFSTSSSVMKHRSIGAGLAYEEQANLLTAARSYDTTRRVPHPMDALFMPNIEPTFWDKWYPK